MKRLLRLAVACVALAACSGASQQEESDPPARPVDARQRDSAIGASGLPGAKAVTRTLEASDAAAGRAAAIDSVLRPR